jgi:hypothetical protein
MTETVEEGGVSEVPRKSEGRRWLALLSRVLFLAAAVLLVWYIAAHWNRWTGAFRLVRTDDAFIVGDVTPLAAHVSGYIIASGDQSGDMRHFDHEIGPHRIRDLAKAREVNEPGIRRSARDNEPGLLLMSNRFDSVEIDQTVFISDAILNGIEPLSGKRGARSVSQVPSRLKRHPQNGVSRLQQSEQNGAIRLGARMGLNVGESGIEELIGTLDRYGLDGVDMFAFRLWPRAEEA